MKTDDSCETDQLTVN